VRFPGCLSSISKAAVGDSKYKPAPSCMKDYSRQLGWSRVMKIDGWHKSEGSSEVYPRIGVSGVGTRLSV
jgi:hypothetical protein